MKKERSRGVKTFSKQNGGISKQKKRKFIGFRIFCMKSHAALEVLTIFSEVSICNYNAKMLVNHEMCEAKVLGFTVVLAKGC